MSFLAPFIGPILTVGATIIGASQAAKARRQGLSAAEATIAEQRDRLIDIQEKFFERGEPFFDIAEEELEELRGSAALGLGDAALTDEFRFLESELGKTGNIRSGGGADLFQRAIERASDRAFQRRSNLVSLATGQGGQLFGAGAQLSGGITGLTGDIGTAQARVGAVQGDLFGTLGGLAGSVIKEVGGIFGGGGGVGTGKGPVDPTDPTNF